MYFLNLSLPEFLALAGALSSVVVALYLLDRRRRRYVVATLRFLRAAARQPETRHRRHIQQPWSLALELIAMLLLLLAIAQLRFGSPANYSRDHVLLLDTSAWMGASAANKQGQPQTLMDEARAQARAYLATLPGADRVMLVRAGELPTPVTQFESDRAKLRAAIDATQPGAGSLNIFEALEFATDAQHLQAQRPGEIVFVGAGRLGSEPSSPAKLPANLRVISVASPAEHAGLRKLAVHRSFTDPDTWLIFVSVKNYGTHPRDVPLAVQFGGAPAGSQLFHLAGGQEQDATFQYRTRAAGWLEARLLSSDAFPQDNRAILELPARETFTVTVYSSQPDLLRPAFAAIPGVQTTFVPPSRYDPAANTRVAIFDRFSPGTTPNCDAIWIDPPTGHSPIAVVREARNVNALHWRGGTALTEGLRAKDVQLARASVLHPDEGDDIVADTDAGPVAVARQGSHKILVLGFDPVQSAIKYDLTTPLLFANALRWMAPNLLRYTELTAGTAGSMSVTLDAGVRPQDVRVTSDDGLSIPFTVNGRTLQFFTDRPGVVRVAVGGRELVYSQTLPQPGDSVWKPTHVRTGLPSRMRTDVRSRDLWQALALLAAAALLADWYLYGRKRARQAAALYRQTRVVRKAS